MHEDKLVGGDTAKLERVVERAVEGKNRNGPGVIHKLSTWANTVMIGIIITIGGFYASRLYEQIDLALAKSIINSERLAKLETKSDIGATDRADLRERWKEDIGRIEKKIDQLDDKISKLK